VFRRDWIPPYEYNNQVYEGLDLELSDDFPALAFRINCEYSGRKPKVGDKNVSFRQLLIDEDDKGNFYYKEK
jgi:hypothetical protein